MGAILVGVFAYTSDVNSEKKKEDILLKNIKE